jgi:PAS domain S-box-containing protein
MLSPENPAIANIILDSLGEGLYVCDTERRITYWSKSAERITGWTAAQVEGHRCCDNILDHVDKDGRRLCGEEFCPLHRSMRTDKASTAPLIVFGQTSSGGRLPMSVSVAPIHDPHGQVVGGVETFHDFSESYANLLRAKRIQTLSMAIDLPRDSRVGFASFYLPHDMIGGDFFAIQQLNADRYGFVVADVMGHGVAAALHTMHLSSLWSRHFPRLASPAEFARRINGDLCRIVRDESFATAVCGVLDAARRTVRFASAGGPPLVLLRGDGRREAVEASGWPFGMADDADYDEMELACAPGDCLLMFTDGAIEIHDAAGTMLGTEGLLDILASQGYPGEGIRIEALQEALLTYSNEIRLDDDLTLLEVRFT